jgi:hypothetical protein
MPEFVNHVFERYADGCGIAVQREQRWIWLGDRWFDLPCRRCQVVANSPIREESPPDSPTCRRLPISRAVGKVTWVERPPPGAVHHHNAYTCTRLPARYGQYFCCHLSSLRGHSADNTSSHQPARSWTIMLGIDGGEFKDDFGRYFRGAKGDIAAAAAADHGGLHVRHVCATGQNRANLEGLQG